MSLKDIADRLNLSRVARALLCTCGSGIPEEDSHIIASLIGHAQMRLADFSCIYTIAFNNAENNPCGTVYFGLPGDHSMFPFESGAELLEILTNKYEILQQMDQ